MNEVAWLEVILKGQSPLSAVYMPICLSGKEKNRLSSTFNWKLSHLKTTVLSLSLLNYEQIDFVIIYQLTVKNKVSSSKTLLIHRELDPYVMLKSANNLARSCRDLSLLNKNRQKSPHIILKKEGTGQIFWMQKHGAASQSFKASAGQCSLQHTQLLS